MLDPLMRKMIDPPLNWAGQQLAQRQIKATHLTVFGFICALLAFISIWLGGFLLGLAFLILNRLADGLDGAVARASGVTDLGGFLDITLDFIAYSAIVLAFAFYQPQQNALMAALLLFAFMGTASSFLTFAIFAQKHGLETQQRGKKSLYYLGGLAEGTETFLFLASFCLFPAYFPYLAGAFTVICLITTSSRIAIAVCRSSQKPAARSLSDRCFFRSARR